MFWLAAIELQVSFNCTVYVDEQLSVAVPLVAVVLAIVDPVVVVAIEVLDAYAAGDVYS